MKTSFPDPGPAAAAYGPAPLAGDRRGAVDRGPATEPEGGTREAVVRLLLDRPATAGDIADRLGISPAGVRRHLDALVEEGAVTSRDSIVRRRGRGRPPKEFLLTDVGRSRLPHSYDDLAVEALQFLQRTAGDEAVRQFAHRRATALVEGHRAELAAAPDTEARIRMLGEILTGAGFSASMAQVGVGHQLCQHHCPVAHVAEQFPQLCQAELEVFAEVIGSYSQRLATIANGDSFCTTFIPDPADHHASLAPSAPATGRTSL